jgi:hypothetical protein
MVEIKVENREGDTAAYWNNGTFVNYNIPAINTKDTIVTTFIYSDDGVLFKKTNSKGAYQTISYNKAKQILHDTIIGHFWENETFPADTSIGVYKHFKGGYTVNRVFSDNKSSQIDTFWVLKGRVLRHLTKFYKYLDEPCSHGLIGSIRDYRIKYANDNKIVEKLYYCWEKGICYIEKYVWE